MKIVKWLVVLLAGVSLVIVAGVFIRNKVVGPAGWAKDNTVDQLKTDMRDPGSMVIRSSYIVSVKAPGKNSTTLVLCGVVDAKNDAGAYTGGLRFLSASVDDNDAGTFDTGPVLIEDPAQKVEAQRLHVLSNFESAAWNTRCVDAAHPALAPA